MSLACFQGRWLGLEREVANWTVVEDGVYSETAWCKVSSYTLLVLVKISISVVSLISLERFIVLRFPLRHYRFVTPIKTGNVACACPETF